MTPVHCPAGGPAGSNPLLFGPEPGGTSDLWRQLDDDAGEGQSFTVPRDGVIDRVRVQLFASAGASQGQLKLVRWCDGAPGETRIVERDASAFPIYVIDVDSTATMWDQDLSETEFVIDPPLPVASGERVDAVFRGLGGWMVSVITTHDSTPNSHAIFPNGHPGIIEDPDWDYHARLHLQ